MLVTFMDGGEHSAPYRIENRSDRVEIDFQQRDTENLETLESNGRMRCLDLPLRSDEACCLASVSWEGGLRASGGRQSPDDTDSLSRSAAACLSAGMRGRSPRCHTACRCGSASGATMRSAR